MILSTLWTFARSPLGRWTGAVVAVLALLAGVHHHGYTQGRDREKAAQRAAVERARKDVARREAVAVQITDKAVALPLSYGRKMLRAGLDTDSLRCFLGSPRPPPGQAKYSERIINRCRGWKVLATPSPIWSLPRWSERPSLLRSQRTLQESH